MGYAEPQLIPEPVELPDGYRVCAPKAHSRAKKGGTRYIVYCGRIKPEGQMKVIRRKDKQWVSNQCLECARETHRRWYAQNKQRAKDRAAQWKRDNPDRIDREAEKQRAKDRRQRLIQEDPEYHAKHAARAREAYGHDRDRILARNAARRSMGLLEQRAKIPVHLFEPYLRHEVEASSVEYVAEQLGVDNRIINGVLRHEYPGVKLELVDAFALRYGSITTSELTENAREWAELTGADWPMSFLPNGKGYKQRKTAGEIKRTVVLKQRQAA